MVGTPSPRRRHPTPVTLRRRRRSRLLCQIPTARVDSHVRPVRGEWTTRTQPPACAGEGSSSPARARASASPPPRCSPREGADLVLVSRRADLAAEHLELLGLARGPRARGPRRPRGGRGGGPHRGRGARRSRHRGLQRRRGRLRPRARGRSGGLRQDGRRHVHRSRERHPRGRSRTCASRAGWSWRPAR